MTSILTVFGVVFPNDENSTNVYNVLLNDDAKDEIEKLLNPQIEKFKKLKAIPFDGQYKPEDDGECLSINNYKDEDKTIENFLNIINAKSSKILTKDRVFDNCLALLFRVKSDPDLVIIQRFTLNYLASRKAIFGFADGDTVKKITPAGFMIASSVAAIYKISTKELFFRNIQTVGAIFPKFLETYSPGASKQEIRTFFKNNIFDKNTHSNINVDSKRISRLVWLINKSGVTLRSYFVRFKKVDTVLEMKCCIGRKIKIPDSVEKTEIILNVFLGNIIEYEGNLYLSNSRRPLAKFV